jgi:hypothetical protein
VTFRAAIDPASLRAAWWTATQIRRVRRRLRRRGIIDGARDAVAAPPNLPPRAARGVRAVLRRQPSTCLERALVLQRWLAATGDAREIVIGVQGPSATFRAHAWIDGEDDGAAGTFVELMRLPAR